MFTAACNHSIHKGWSSGESYSFLYVKREGLTNLPDGNYLIEIYLYIYGRSLLTSKRTMMRICDGIPIFDYDYHGPTISIFIPIQTIASTIVLISFTSIYGKN